MKRILVLTLAACVCACERTPDQSPAPEVVGPKATPVQNAPKTLPIPIQPMISPAIPQSTPIPIIRAPAETAPTATPAVSPAPPPSPASPLPSPGK